MKALLVCMVAILSLSVVAACSPLSVSQQPYVVTAQPTLFEGSIQGHVYTDGTNTSITGARIWLVNATNNNTTYGSVVADKGGYYYFVNVAPLGAGSYRIKGQKGNDTGYSPTFGVASLENKTIDTYIPMSPAGVNITFSRSYVVADGSDHVSVFAAVKDSMSGPVTAGREVTFTILGHQPGAISGSIVPKSAVTDNNGVARAEYGWAPEMGAASVATVQAFVEGGVYANSTIEIKASDTTSPVTELRVSGEPDNMGGFISDVTCTLTASDPGGWGVNRTYYRTDDAGWQQYGGPFKITGEGGTTLYYYSTDLAGNAEKPHNRTIVIHKK